jgi:transposase
MNIRYRVTLTPEERQQLEALVRGGKGAVRKLKRAQILLAADARSTDEAIARNVGVGTSTVYRTKQRFVEEGLELALKEASRPGPPRKLSASDEALLVAVACSRPPSGQARWTCPATASASWRSETSVRLGSIVSARSATVASRREGARTALGT